MHPRLRSLLLAAGLLVAAGYLWQQVTRTASTAPGPSADAAGVAEIERLFAERRSDTWVEATGVVERILADDDRGSRHQRFILRLTPDLTLLISHNIDLAPRVPLAPGDRLGFRGEYEWNERGGVVHWTHHDPTGRRTGGWITHRDQHYD